MKFRIPVFVLLTVLFAGCTTDKWAAWTSKSSNEQVELQNKTEAMADKVIFKSIDLENVPLSEAIAYLNENQNTYGAQKVTVTAVTQPIKDFSRNPDVEIADMMNTRVSAKGENLSLDQALEQLLKDVPWTAQGTRFITYYADKQIYLLPRKYHNAYLLCNEHRTYFSTGNAPDTPFELMLSMFNSSFDYDGFKNLLHSGESLQIKLNVPDEAEKKRLLGQIVKGPFGDNPSLADLIAIVKKQLNLNCYFDDDGNLSLEPKAPAQP